MTYITGGNIQATDYNSLATSANKIYGDIYSGAATLPNAGYGYGKTNLANVAVGDNITAAQWSALFDATRNSGAHQGITTVPPLPASNPVPGDPIIPYTGIGTVLSNLETNRFTIAPGQGALQIGANNSSSTSWGHTQSFSFVVNFGSWNNARYFFNTGGRLQFNGSYSTTATQLDRQWIKLLSDMSPLVFNYISTTPATGTNRGTGAGFYGLTSTPQDIYRQTASAGHGPYYYYYYYYANNYVNVAANLVGAPGIASAINFTISLVNLDPTPILTTGITTYRLDKFISVGATPYSGPINITTSGFVTT